MRYTYRVDLPDGNVKTRTSHRVYTHVIAVHRGVHWGVSSFCGSLEKAQKECRTQERLDGRYKPPAKEYRVMPVTSCVARPRRERKPRKIAAVSGVMAACPQHTFAGRDEAREADAVRPWAVIDIREGGRYCLIVSRHSTEAGAHEALEAHIAKQLTHGGRVGRSVTGAKPHLMWKVEQVDGDVGDRVRYR